MKLSPRLLGPLALGAAVSVQAASTTYNFDINPLSDPAFNIGNPGGALIVGNHNYNNGTGDQIWCSAAGFAVNGNPATGGYLSIADGTNGNNGFVLVFPDIDGGLPLNGFQIDLDLRVG